MKKFVNNNNNCEELYQASIDQIYLKKYCKYVFNPDM